MKRLSKCITICTVIGVVLTSIHATHAGSATWSLSPTSTDWITAANWTPATVPNGPSDIATFAATNNANVTLGDDSPEDDVEVNSVIFESDASPYNITLGGGHGVLSTRMLTVTGSGIVNRSGVTQNFVNLSPDWYQGAIIFANSASAGDNNVFTNTGDDVYSGGAFIEFHDASNSGTSTFINDGGSIDSNSSLGGRTVFYDDSSADHARFFNNGGYDYGGSTEFYDNSTAASARIVNEAFNFGGPGGHTGFHGQATAGESKIILKSGSSLSFFDDSDADRATIISQGNIFFQQNSRADKTNVRLKGNATVSLTYHNRPGLTLGSLEGEGLITLANANLIVGANNLSTSFGGVLSGAGSITKTGRGRFALTGANTYAGGTTVERGILEVLNTTGSATGAGPVLVKGGTLSGTGVISGSVTIRKGPGTHDSVLSPGSHDVGTLTVQSTLTFTPDGVYDFELSSSSVTSDQLIANGVAIDAGALFAASDVATESLSPGTVFVVIGNTSPEPIAGAFADLADGSTIVIGSNTFQANYEGGDGNDLTLTVVQ